MQCILFEFGRTFGQELLHSIALALKVCCAVSSKHHHALTDLLPCQSASILQSAPQLVEELLCTVACKIMLGRAQPIAFVNIIQLRQALVPQFGRLGPGLVPDLLQGRSMWTVEGSVGRSESDEKNPIYRSPIKHCPMADIGQYRNTRQERSDVRYRACLVASQPTHASILLLMACFA
jgi:hypothetical protein